MRSLRGKRRSQHAGFTLIELIVSIVVAGVLFGMLTVAFAPAVKRGTNPLFAVRAAELGLSYLEEIGGKRYDEASPPGNNPRCGESSAPACVGIGSDETRALYDDVDDYHGLNEQPRDATGAVRPGYANFNVKVSVVYAGTELGLANTQAKRVTVTIADHEGNQTVFGAYKANF